MATALQVIKRSLRMLGAIGSGETPDGSTGADALFVLNRILEEWNTQKLLNYYVAHANYLVLNGTAQYSIGSGGDYDGDRPEKIVSAYLRDNDLKDHVLEIITDKKYSSIYDKTHSGVPQYLQYDAQYPLAYINLYPKPSVNGVLNIGYYMPLTTISALSTSFSLPNGYESALIYQLAAELAPEYGKSIEPFYSQSIKKKAHLKSINTEIECLGVDNALIYDLSGYQISNDIFESMIFEDE